MRTIIAVIFLLATQGCAKKDLKPVGPVIGCESGNINGVRYTFRCCTQQQFAAGDNVKSGGTALFTSFKNVQWAPCPDCK